jgi:amino acid transporter
MAFTAWSYAQMSRVVPHAGSVFAYASEGLGSRAGFIAGWLAMLDYLLIPSVAYLFCGIAMHALVPSISAWVFTVLAFALTTALNLAGVAVAARVGFVVLAAEIIVLVIFIVFATVAIVQDGPARPWASPFTGIDTFDSSAVVGAVSIAVLSFLGFDAIASFAEESTGNSRQVGRAILICLTVARVLFVAQSYLAAVLSPIDPRDLAAHPERQGTAFYDVTRAAIAPWLANLLAITKAVGPAFAAMTAQAAASRLLFAMARDGRLPQALAQVDPRRGVPLTSLSVVATLTLVVSVWAARRWDGLDVLVSIVDVGALAAFTMLHASVVGFYVMKRRSGGARMVYWALPILGACVTVWVIAEASTLAKMVGGVWLAVGVIVSRDRRRHAPSAARGSIR